MLVEGELVYREYSRTVERESSPIQVAWPVTGVILGSIMRLDRAPTANKHEPEGNA